MILNKDLHYNKLMENGFEKFPNKRDLMILGGKWLELDKSIDNDILLDKIIGFCKKFNPEYNPAKNEDMLLGVIKDLTSENKKIQISHPEFIKIFSEEAKLLKKIDNLIHRQILFMFMCIAKWNNCNYVYVNSSSVVNISDIFNLAKMKLTKKERLNVLNSLHNDGYINVLLKPLLKIEVLGVKNEGTVLKEIAVNDDLIDNLKLFCEDYCLRCGKPFDRIKNNQKYCIDCSKVIRNEQIAGYMKRKRYQSRKS